MLYSLHLASNLDKIRRNLAEHSVDKYVAWKAYVKQATTVENKQRTSFIKPTTQ